MKVEEVIKPVGQVTTKDKISFAITDAECDLRVKVGRDAFNQAYDADLVHQEIFALSSQIYVRACVEVVDDS